MKFYFAKIFTRDAYTVKPPLLSTLEWFNIIVCSLRKAEMKIYHTSSHTSSLSNDITLIDRKRKVSNDIDAAHFLIDGKEHATVNHFTLKSKNYEKIVYLTLIISLRFGEGEVLRFAVLMMVQVCTNLVPKVSFPLSDEKMGGLNYVGNKPRIGVDWICCQQCQPHLGSIGNSL